MPISLNRLMKFRAILLLFLCIGFYLIVRLVTRYYSQNYRNSSIDFLKITNPNVNIIDPDGPSLNRNFTCIETREMFNLYHTNLCLHSKTDTISNVVGVNRVWEEDDLKRVLFVLMKNPDMDMIDIGANIGGFTMFTAGALGRFTLAIDCYLPNIERIARAVQMRNVQNRVVLVQNAIYPVSGKSLTIRINDDPSGVNLFDDQANNLPKREYVVKTLRFDDVLPILIARNVKTAMIKIDIEAAESFMCESGSKIFEEINIPYIMMEWHGIRSKYQERYQFIIDFFSARGYVATDQSCKDLRIKDWLRNWPGNVFWLKRNYPRQLLCANAKQPQ
ncbi:unnamed protein product [Adineta steineri]|uniref:Methyltransferase FkbM domain-containing protein n=3 Tax=Adineta steineri TaxID=433720 RepID=A0A818YUF2_9BILA|nr:unnamed protein product [Adineta steineri]